MLLNAKLLRITNLESEMVTLTESSEAMKREMAEKSATIDILIRKMVSLTAAHTEELKGQTDI